MAQPRRIVLRTIGMRLFHPSPSTVTCRQLRAHIDDLPEDLGLNKRALHDQLTFELDGACPAH
jgi:hypothetical protein